MRLNHLNVFAAIKNHEVIPPKETFELLKEQLFPGEEEDYWRYFFNPLQNKKVIPPGGIFQKIVDQITIEEYPVKKRRALTFLYYLLQGFLPRAKQQKN